MLLEVKDLSLTYGDKKVLKNVSFSLNRGEVLCIVGESGSGKSSILLSIMGLLPKNAKLSGSVLLEGKELLNLREEEYRKLRGKEIGIVFQEPSLYLDPLFKIKDQVLEAYTAHFSKADGEERVVEVLKSVGVQDVERVMNSYPHQLFWRTKAKGLYCHCSGLQPKAGAGGRAHHCFRLNRSKEDLGTLYPAKRGGKGHYFGNPRFWSSGGGSRQSFGFKRGGGGRGGRCGFCF
jgi:ABC-type antimicrobial peptide transport system ATPase subunit